MERSAKATTNPVENTEELETFGKYMSLRYQVNRQK